MRKPRTKKAMVEYLKSHFRYDTMNNWNRATSYAVNIKVRNLPHEQQDAVYEMLDVSDSWSASGFNHWLNEFDRRHNYCWQIGVNGRSGGYLVLYQGGAKPSEHKSLCRACGQRNFTAAEPEPAQCGKCHAMQRFNYKFPLQPYTQPGLGLDMGEDFSEWSMDDLRNRVEIVWDFDKTCASAVAAYARYALGHTAQRKTIKVAKEITVAVRRKRVAS